MLVLVDCTPILLARHKQIFCFISTGSTLLPPAEVVGKDEVILGCWPVVVKPEPKCVREPGACDFLLQSRGTLYPSHDTGMMVELNQ